MKKSQVAAEKRAEKAEAEIENVKRLKDEMYAEAQKRIDELNSKITELTKAAEKPAENADKSNFKAMYAAAYKEISGLIEFVREAEPEERELYIRKTLELLNIGKEETLKIELPVEIVSESGSDGDE